MKIQCEFIEYLIDRFGVFGLDDVHSNDYILDGKKYFSYLFRSDDDYMSIIFRVDDSIEMYMHMYGPEFDLSFVKRLNALQYESIMDTIEEMMLEGVAGSDDEITTVIDNVGKSRNQNPE